MFTRMRVCATLCRVELASLQLCMQEMVWPTSLHLIMIGTMIGSKKSSASKQNSGDWAENCVVHFISEVQKMPY